MDVFMGRLQIKRGSPEGRPQSAVAPIIPENGKWNLRIEFEKCLVLGNFGFPSFQFADLGMFILSSCCFLLITGIIRLNNVIHWFINGMTVYE